MGFNEKVHAYIAAKYYVYLTESFGERGERAFLHATQYYAAQRGRRMAQRAIRDGKELTQETYNYYGEWVSTDELKKAGCANRSEPGDNGSIRILSCPWYTQFQEMGLAKAGAVYCSDLDASISRGFNPKLGFVLEQTLYTAPCCIQRLAEGDILAGAQNGKNPDSLRDFEYHCAHLFWSYREVSTAIFGEEGKAAAGKVLQDFTADYGKEMADRLLRYENVNFNVCD